MATFCFISFAQPGHCDFGGMSFIRTAQGLRRRGHKVRWVLSHPQQEHLYLRARALLDGFEIPIEDLGHIYLTIDHRNEDIRPSARTIAQYISTVRYDCIVLDRLCIGAAFAAHMAGIPWAVIGTDGREWSHQKRRLMLNSAVFPGPRSYSHIEEVAKDLCSDDFPRPSSSSYWATSPFLNISFFPKSYYNDENREAFLEHTHFVGSGPAIENLSERKHLLITFGNSFHPILREQLLSVVLPFLRKQSISTLVLTGEEKLTKSLRGIFESFKHVTVKTWVPYDESYREAAVAVGHGGTSHIWYGMLEGSPLLAIPFVGDQWYGGLQIERLNIGRTILPLVIPVLSSRALRKHSKIGIRLNRNEFANKLNDVFTNKDILDNSLRISRTMRTGGGVKASASLLECLAREQACVSRCVDPACCC